ncbi:MAG: hypothetical protein U9Q62_06615, partial [Campylobacterota bacterium]|nr:hypothetical protein [Campylobacterota bacterium]
AENANNAPEAVVLSLGLDLDNVTYTENATTTSTHSSSESINLSKNSGPATITLDSDATTTEVTIKNFKVSGGGADSGTLYAYDADGNEVTSLSLDDSAIWTEISKNTASITLNTDTPFSSIKIVSDGNSQFKVLGVEASTPQDSYEYDFSLSALTTDADAELSSVTLSSLPDGTSLYDSNGDAVPSTEGVYDIDMNSNNSLNFTLVSNTELNESDIGDIYGEITATNADGNSTVSHSFVNTTEISGDETDESIIGTDSNEFIDAADGADTIDAGAGNDTIVFDATDTVDGGAGFDTLVVNEGVTIDFGAISENISNIEQLDLSQGNQTVQQLRAEDVLEITPNADHTLRISGDDTDTVELNKEGDDAEWTQGESIEGEDGHTYDVYSGLSDSGDNVTLEIDQNINISDF